MSTEEEQIKQLKQWWNENGLSTIGSIVIAIAVVLSWQAWQQQKQNKLDSAAFAYEQLLTAIENVAQAPGDDIVIAQATHQANQIKENYSQSGFATFAALFNARQAIADQDLEAAEQELRWALEQSANNELHHIAALRLARVLYAQQRYEEALALVNDTSDSGFDPLYGELKGDILLAQEQYQPAHDAYAAAKSAAEARELTLPPLLETKLQFAGSFL